jgi:adenosylmethionine-8-amino-7-oxononanoate aminotransferase
VSDEIYPEQSEAMMAAARDMRATEMDGHGDDDAVELAKRHLVQPWPFAGSVGTEARALIGEGEGIYITDGTGQRLIDGPAGMWCVNVGHRREELARVMYDQAMALSYNTPWYTMNAPSAELAKRIAGNAPGDLSHVFFTTGGSSAVETALRFMQFYNNVRGRPEKKLILSRGGAYHGSTFLSASLNGRPRDRDWMDGADDLVVKLSSPDPFRRPQGMSVAAFTDYLVDEFRDTVTRVGADKIGAFVGEPVQASGGVVVPPDGYLKRIREICRDNGILYISDEVVTAFGRLGHVFASGDVFGIDPDMITFAKGVTSGYFPLGGVIISERLLEELLMGCVECVADRESKDPLQLDKDVGKRIDAHCHELGLLVRPLINMCVMSPPLIITREQIDDMVAILREGISRTMDDLRKEGVWRG